MRPPAGPVYWLFVSTLLSSPWIVVAIGAIGFFRHRRKNKKLREQEEKERGATP